MKCGTKTLKVRFMKKRLEIEKEWLEKVRTGVVNRQFVWLWKLKKGRKSENV